MIILGIDPGYERLGIAVLKKEDNYKKEIVLYSECFKTSAKISFEDRLFLIGEEIERVIKKYKTEILAIETLFLNTNQKTVMKVAEVIGIIIYQAKKYNLKIFEASPPQIKNSITGYGRADKNQMIKMIKLLVDIKKNKKNIKESDDELDAIAIALTAFANIRFIK